MNIEKITYEQNRQNDYLKILLECLKKINHVIQNTDSFDNPKKILELLKDAKTNLDNTRNNISNLQTLKKHLNDLSTGIPDESAQNNYNELALAYTNILQSTSQKLIEFLFDYVKTTNFVIDNIDLNLVNSKEDDEINGIESNNKTINIDNTSIQNDTKTLTVNPFIENKPVLSSQEPSPLVSPNNINTLPINPKPVQNKDLTETVSNSYIYIKNSINSEKKEKKQPANKFKTETDKNNIENYTDCNVLLISEKQNKVFLPYTVSDLKTLFEQNITYRTLQDVIDDQYTIPLDRYKNSAISRFKEGYNLMRKKEKASFTDSLDLALELTFSSSLNPAVITACKNLEELDIYLDCLNSNKLEKFNLFEVKYEFLPTK